MKLGNIDEKEDPQKEKEKSTIEKIKMLYKSENKRENRENREHEMGEQKKKKNGGH